MYAIANKQVEKEKKMRNEQLLNNEEAIVVKSFEEVLLICAYCVQPLQMVFALFGMCREYEVTPCKNGYTRKMESYTNTHTQTHVQGVPKAHNNIVTHNHIVQRIYYIFTARNCNYVNNARMWCEKLQTIFYRTDYT